MDKFSYTSEILLRVSGARESDFDAYEKILKMYVLRNERTHNKGVTHMYSSFCLCTNKQ